MKLYALFIVAFLAASHVVASRDFPSEEQLNVELRPGMTVGEVIERFGQPNSQVSGHDGSFMYRYIAPLGYLRADREGYTGFELHFVEGKIHDWQTFRGSPSYAPIQTARDLRWYFRVWLLIGACVVIYGLIRRSRATKDEDQALLEAYVAKRIQTQRLPEFQFITHETTLQEVIDKVGEPSRTRELSFESIVGPEKAAAYNVSGMSIGVAEYDLPYRAAAIVMPEYPCQPENGIRAVFYRGPQADDET